MTFQIGEKVVYPNHGIGTVENITTRSFGAQDENYYLLRIAYNSLTVMVPFSHVDDIRLRKVTKNAEVAHVLSFFASGTCRMHPDWKVRFRENTEKMNGGSLLEIAEIVKGLAAIQLRKPLSFREKKMLDRARHMVINEVMVARNLMEDGAIDLLQKALGKAGLPLPEAL